MKRTIMTIAAVALTAATMLGATPLTGDAAQVTVAGPKPCC